MPPTQSLVVQKIVSVGVLAIGVALLAFCIYFEGEPGALPLLLVLVGSGWNVVTRWRIRKLA